MDLHISDPSSAPEATRNHLGTASSPNGASSLSPTPVAVAAPEPPPAPGPPRAAEPPSKAESAAIRAKKRRRARRRRFDLPAWAVSLLVHVVILSLLGAA